MIAYRLITALLAPLVVLGLLLRGHGLPSVVQRLGFVPVQRAPVLWFHAASVGEFRALLPLISRSWEQSVVLTVQSKQALITAREHLPASIPVLSAPLDAPGWFGRFLKRIRPQALVLVESELWPGWMHSLHAANVPAILLDGVLSETSARRWRRWPALVRPVAQAVHAVTVSSQARQSVFQALGFSPIELALPLKLAGQVLAVEADLVARWQAWLDGAALVTLANVHRSEVPALKALLDTIEPDTKVIIAPRHPAHLAAIRAGLGPASARLAYWPGFGTLGSLYALGGKVVMGGGFDAAIGSHNPLEALRAGCAVVCGPHAGKQRELIAFLEHRKMIARTPHWPVDQDHAEALRTLSEQATEQAVQAVESVLRRSLN